MKLAKQIVAAAEGKYGNAPYQDQGTPPIDVIIADAGEWESIIAAKLGPAKEILREINDTVNNVEELTDHDNLPEGWAANADFALSEISHVTKAALALLSESDGNNKEV